MRSVIGVVRNVVDGDTFDLEPNESLVVERVRIAGNYGPEAGTFAALLAASLLRRQLLGRTVRCDIHGYDSHGHLVCTVEVIADAGPLHSPATTMPLQPVAMSAS